MSEDPYRKSKTRGLTQQPYRDGFIVWNWDLKKWDYFGEEQQP